MGVKWTEEQLKATELKGRNILVSAAAGSGKTAVLVGRIIKMVTDRENPTDIDRILTVTFTEAAAAEMKERILAALEKALEEEPGNERLAHQASLIHAASISTIHGFCLSVIKDNFHVIGLDPSFRTADEGELKLLKHDVLQEFLEEQYKEGDGAFLEFVEQYASGRDDRKIEDLILKLYGYSMSYPDPDRWLALCADAYKNKDRQYEGQILKFAGQKAEDAFTLLNEALRICEEPDGPYMHKEALISDANIAKSIQDAQSYPELYRILANISWKALSTKSDEYVNTDKRARVKELRDKVKKIINEFAKNYFYEDPETIRRDMESAARPADTLTGLIKGFGEAFARKKRAKNIIDFSDMEQFALKILTENKDGVLVPSDAAREYRRRFKEVMIDEYQDSNFLQEIILTSVSSSGSGRDNIFMVGDVKQSIYGFRLSRPELFMEKYDTYSTSGEGDTRIDLHKNFRSRQEVLDSVNFIFRRIMRKGLGNVDYDEAAFLNGGAAYDPCTGQDGEPLCATELLIVETKEDAEGGGQGDKEDPAALEARCIAKRIRKLLKEGKVTENNGRIFRKPRFRDIVILSRSVKALSPVFLATLRNEGIPVYSDTSEGYFETYEVSIILDYLKILDNFRQDLPLAAVLASPIVGFHAEEMAKIRSAFPDIPFYEAVRSYASDKFTCADVHIQSELKDFFAKLKSFREMAPFTSIDELLWRITEDTGYGAYISAMPGGEARSANLKMLEEKASDFEKTSYRGLFNFVRYIEQLKKYDVDYKESETFSEQSEAVRIMTIHKSKGLEFPIVFLAGTSRKFNMSDTKGGVVAHSRWGVGINAVDLDKRTQAPTVIKKIIQEEIRRENLGEELRVLYVAMTRAKEKLIITGAVPDADKKISAAKAGGTKKERPLPYYVLSSATSYMDWLIPAIFSTEGEVPIKTYVFSREELKAEDSVQKAAGAIARDILENWDFDRVYDADIKKQLKEQLKFEYPYRTERLGKMKFSVTELKDAEHEFESGLRTGSPDSVEEMFEEEMPVPYLPEFAREAAAPGGAYIGTAYHKVMELIDFTKDYDEESLAGQIEGFAKDGRIGADAVKAVVPGDILSFLNSPTGIRARRAAAFGRLKREQPFVMEVDAQRIYPDIGEGEKVLIQGVIDAYFEEGGALILLDYKTDRAKDASALIERYRSQLMYYAEALSRLTGKEVREIYIYSFRLKKEISLYEKMSAECE